MTTDLHISAQQVKELRDRTAAGFMECKAALTEAGGDVEQAILILRKKGMVKAQTKAGRVATEGLIGSYIHTGTKIGVIVEVNCESDFVARTEEFRRLAHELAMHIAAADPRFIRREDVTPNVLEREKEVYRAQAKALNKPEPVIERIVEGKLKEFYEKTVLYDQHFIKDESQTIKELIDSHIALLKENIIVRRFARFKVGEGMEKAERSGAGPAQAGESHG